MELKVGTKEKLSWSGLIQLAASKASTKQQEVTVTLLTEAFKKKPGTANHQTLGYFYQEVVRVAGTVIMQNLPEDVTVAVQINPDLDGVEMEVLECAK